MRGRVRTSYQVTLGERFGVFVTACVLLTGTGGATAAANTSARCPKPRIVDIHTTARGQSFEAADLLTASDGRLWAAGQGYVGTVDPSGAVTGIAVPHASGVSDMAQSPDGAVWLTTYADHTVVRVGQDLAVTEFPVIDEFTRPTAITFGPDGNLWITTLHEKQHTNRVVRMGVDGAVTVVRRLPGFAPDIITDPMATSGSERRRCADRGSSDSRRREG